MIVFNTEDLKLIKLTGAGDGETSSQHTQHTASRLSLILHPIQPQLNPNLSQLNQNFSPSLSKLNPNLSQLNPSLSQLNPNLSQLNPNFSQLVKNVSQLNLNMSQLNPHYIANLSTKEELEEVTALAVSIKKNFKEMLDLL